jgi:hypothetical protein
MYALTATPLQMFENVLQMIGAFVSFSIAYVSYRGLKQTNSGAFLRLSTAFFFLAFGFLIEALVGFGEAAIIPGVASITATLLVAGLLLETTGYFFLAFSHAIDVILAKRLGAAFAVVPIVTLTIPQMGNILQILSFYFVLYGVVETLYAYGTNRRPDTLLIASGLGLIACGAFTQWLSVLNPDVNVLSLLQIIMKEVGLMLLFVPVIRFTVGTGVKPNGTI